LRYTAIGGELVFKSADKDFKWDGIYENKKLNTAVFVYALM